MDEIRQERLLTALQTRFHYAQQETQALPEEEWARLRSEGLEATLSAMERISTMSPEHRRIREAVALLHPHREAWKIINEFGEEILSAPANEQEQLLARTLDVLESSALMSRVQLEQHVYAFWPVRIDKPYAPAAGNA